MHCPICHQPKRQHIRWPLLARAENKSTQLHNNHTHSKMHRIIIVSKCIAGIHLIFSTHLCVKLTSKFHQITPMLFIVNYVLCVLLQYLTQYSHTKVKTLHRSVMLRTYISIFGRKTKCFFLPKLIHFVPCVPFLNMHEYKCQTHLTFKIVVGENGTNIVWVE